MRMLERLGDLHDNFHGLLLTNASLTQNAVVHGFSVNVLHDKIMLIASLANIQRANDVLIIQFCSRAAFLIEALNKFGIAGKFQRKNFDGNQAIE